MGWSERNTYITEYLLKTSYINTKPSTVKTAGQPDDSRFM